MLLVMWMAGCSLAALASVALSAANGPWLLGFAAILAAQGVVLAGRAARLPAWVTWPAALGLVALYAVRYGAGDLVAYVGLAAALMIFVDRIAALSDGISTYLLPDGRTSAPTDPIARDFARVRREELPLSVALVSFSEPRRSSRRLARVVHELLPYLRVTDAVVRLAAGGVVVVLPGADARVAAAVLGRALAAEPPGLLLGVATFPEDGQTFAVLKEVARSRQRPWPGDAGPRMREPRRSPAPQPVGGGELPAVLVEARGLDLPLRRAVDVLVLMATAPLTVPLVGALALAVKLDSPRPRVRPDQAPRARRPAVRAPEAAQHDARRRPHEGAAQAPQHDDVAGLQDRRRSARHAPGTGAAQDLAGRAAPALQRAARPDDADRPATLLGPARRLPALAERAARGHPRHRRPLAGGGPGHDGLRRPLPARHRPGSHALASRSTSCWCWRPSVPYSHRRGPTEMDLSALPSRVARRWWVVAAAGRAGGAGRRDRVGRAAPRTSRRRSGSCCARTRR